MTIDQRIITKLQPHSQRISLGEGQDFDYLPAVLLHLIEEQSRQEKLTKEHANSIQLDISNVKNIIERTASRNQEQISAFEGEVNSRFTIIVDAIKKSASKTQEQISSFEDGVHSRLANIADAINQTNKALRGISMQMDAHELKIIEGVSIIDKKLEALKIDLMREGKRSNDILIGLNSVLMGINSGVELGVRSTHKLHQKLMRLLIGVLLICGGILGVAVTILQR